MNRIAVDEIDNILSFEIDNISMQLTNEVWKTRNFVKKLLSSKKSFYMF